MTNTIVSNMVGTRDVEGPLLGAKSNFSPTKGKPKSVRNSPRGKQYDFHHEWEKNRVRFGHCSYLSPRGSPNGKSRGTPSKSPRQSPSHSELYAGFSDSPAPAALPKPPSHWMTSVQMSASTSCHREAVRYAPNMMKLLLNAQV